MTRKIKAIVAMDEGRVIGIKNALPWNIPEDMERFKKLTLGHAVLMGRHTYESLPPRFRPLPKRKNIVVTRVLPPGATGEDLEIWSSLEDALQAFRDGRLRTPTEDLWIVGGAQIYEQSQPLWDELYLTLVKGKHDGDAYFPAFEAEMKPIEKIERQGFSFLHYVRQ